jgi:hypothetical protein
MDFDFETFAREVWIPALRSGAYRQGKELLRSTGHEGDQFCCLGVAAHEASRVLKGVVTWTSPTDEGVFTVFCSGRGRMDVLPQTLARMFGISEIGSFDEVLTVDRDVLATMSESARRALDSSAGHPSQYYYSLVELNDSGEFTFNDIATIIEASLDGKATPFLKES